MDLLLLCHLKEVLLLQVLYFYLVETVEQLLVNLEQSCMEKESEPASQQGQQSTEHKEPAKEEPPSNDTTEASPSLTTPTTENASEQKKEKAIEEDQPSEKTEEPAKEESPSNDTKEASKTPPVGDKDTSLRRKNKENLFTNKELPTTDLIDSEPVDFTSKEDRKSLLKGDEYVFRPVWIGDTERHTCSTCGIRFALLKRRHHCRACGEIFCARCCKSWILLPPQFGYVDPERVCKACFAKHSNLDLTRTYEVFGPDDSKFPTILLLHGALCNRLIHKFQIEAFSKHYRLIAMDLPAHGSRVDELLTHNSAIQAIRDVVLKEVKEQKVILYGYSLGGYAALHFAKKYPENCRALILGGCCNQSYGNMVDIFYSVIGMVYKLTPASKMWKYMPSTIGKGIPREAFSDTILRSGMTYEKWPECSALMKENHSGEYVDTIKSFTGPILFINGSEDYRSAEDIFYQAASNARKCIIAGANHLVCINPAKRAEFNAAVLEFLHDLGFDQEKKDT